MITKQFGFWQDTYIGNIRNKLSELCKNNSNIIADERQILLEYWRTFDNLDEILEDKLTDFLSWWERATLPETLSRALRSLKAEGIIEVSPEAEQQRREQEQDYRQYWGNQPRAGEEE